MTCPEYISIVTSRPVSPLIRANPCESVAAGICTGWTARSRALDLTYDGTNAIGTNLNDESIEWISEIRREIFVNFG